MIYLMAFTIDKILANQPVWVKYPTILALLLLCDFSEYDLGVYLVCSGRYFPISSSSSSYSSSSISLSTFAEIISNVIPPHSVNLLFISSVPCRSSYSNSSPDVFSLHPHRSPPLHWLRDRHCYWNHDVPR